MTGTVDENLLLIKEIKVKPALWNQYSPNYHQRDVTDQIWDELSKKYSVSVDQLKAKWLALRSQFRRLYLRQIQFHKTNTGKKTAQSWKYFIPLLFLRNQMRKHKTRSGVQPRDPNSDSDEEIVGEMMKEFDAMEADYEEPPSPHFTQQSATQISKYIDYNLSNSPPNAVLNELLESFQKDMIALEKEKIASIDESKTDEDVLFLHSLLPYMKSLNSKKKLILRTKIQSLVCDYIKNLDDNYFNAVTAYSAENKAKDIAAVNEENACDIRINVYDKLDVSQSKGVPILEENRTSENMVNGEEIDFNETNQYGVSFSEDNNTALDDGITLKCFKDDACIWLLNVDE